MAGSQERLSGTCPVGYFADGREQAAEPQFRTIFLEVKSAIAETNTRICRICK